MEIIPRESNNFLSLGYSDSSIFSYQVSKVASETFYSLPVSPVTGSLLGRLFEWKEDICSRISDLIYELSSEDSLEEELKAFCKEQKHLKQDHGPKYRGLMEFWSLIKKTETPGVQVPKPIGVHHSEVKEFLEVKEPEIFSLWEMAGRLYKESGTQSILGNEMLHHLLLTLQHDIRVAFNNGKESALLPDLEDTLYSIRSDSSEDQLITNAGGNKSKNYVSKELVFSTLGEIVASYFDPHSLQNLINGGINPFDKLPQLSVVVQKTIGEQVGGEPDPKKVPSSLVLFTNIGNEKTRIMRISATRGHGEAVVGSQGVKSDNIYLMQSRSNPEQLYVWYDNQPKPYRLAPVADRQGEVQLQLLSNEGELATAPSLDMEMLSRLFALGLKIEAETGHPMDMEAVVKEGTIYSVQKRVFNGYREDLHPSFIDPRKLATAAENPVHSSFKTKILVSGDRTVYSLSSKDELLTAPNLEEAERQFDAAKNKAVVVFQDEPSNSHPVINFSSLGIPCFFARSEREASQLISEASEGKKLIICSQTGTVYLWASQTEPDSFIEEGYWTFPETLSRSAKLTHPFAFEELPPLPQPVKELLLQVRAAETTGVALKALESLREFTREQSGKFQMAVDHAKPFAELSESAKQVIDAVERLEGAVSGAFEELEAAVRSKSVSDLELVFRIKALESLLGATDESQVPLSIMGLEPQVQALKEMVIYLEQGPEYRAFTEEAALGSLIPNWSYQWREFLKGYEESRSKGFFGGAINSLMSFFTKEKINLKPQKLGQLKAFLLQLREAGVFSLWASRVFTNIIQKELSASEMVDEFLSGWTSEVADTLSSLIAKRKLFDQIKTMTVDISTPGKFVRSWNRIYEKVQPLLEVYPLKQEVPFIVQKTRQNLMVDTINFVDDLAKAVREDRTLDEETKKRQMKMILNPMMETLRKWAEESPGVEKFIYHGKWRLRKILDHAERLLRSDLPLRTKSDFDVLRATIGSGLSFDQVGPKALDQLQTWIHQSLLEVAVADQDKKQPLPHGMEEIKEEFLRQLNWDIECPVKEGMEDRFSEDGVLQVDIHLLKEEVFGNIEKFLYRIPIYWHYVTLEFVHNRSSGKIEAKVILYGVVAKNNQKRNALNNAVFSVLDRLNVLNLSSPPEYIKDKFCFSLLIDDDEKLIEAANFLKGYMKITVRHKYTAERMYQELENTVKRHRLTQEELLDFFTHSSFEDTKINGGIHPFIKHASYQLLSPINYLKLIDERPGFLRVSDAKRAVDAVWDSQIEEDKGFVRALLKEELQRKNVGNIILRNGYLQHLGLKSLEEGWEPEGQQIKGLIFELLKSNDLGTIALIKDFAQMIFKMGSHEEKNLMIGFVLQALEDGLKNAEHWVAISSFQKEFESLTGLMGQMFLQESFPFEKFFLFDHRWTKEVDDSWREKINSSISEGLLYAMSRCVDSSSYQHGVKLIRLFIEKSFDAHSSGLTNDRKDENIINAFENFLKKWDYEEESFDPVFQLVKLLDVFLKEEEISEEDRVKLINIRLIFLEYVVPSLLKRGKGEAFAKTFMNDIFAFYDQEKYSEFRKGIAQRVPYVLKGWEAKELFDHPLYEVFIDRYPKIAVHCHDGNIDICHSYLNDRVDDSRFDYLNLDKARLLTDRWCDAEKLNRGDDQTIEGRRLLIEMLFEIAKEEKKKALSRLKISERDFEKSQPMERELESKDYNFNRKEWAGKLKIKKTKRYLDLHRKNFKDLKYILFKLRETVRV